MGLKPLIDLTDQRFGRWTVKCRIQNKQKTQAMWLCVCDCGITKTVPGSNLRNGTSTSCGCYAKDFQRQRIAREGWAAKPVTGATFHVVEKDGKSMTLAEWSKETGISLSVLVRRWNRGWPNERLLEPTPAQLEKQFEYVEPQFEI